MPLANVNFSTETFLDHINRTNQIIQIINEQIATGYYSNGNVAVNGTFRANGSGTIVGDANNAGNVTVGKTLTIENDLNGNVSLNVSNGKIYGDGGYVFNVRHSVLTSNSFTITSNTGTISKGGSAELSKTLFLDVVTSSGLSDVSSSNVASAASANSLDLHIKTVHAQVNTIIATDLPSKQTLNTNLTLLSNVGSMSNGDILVFANNRLEKLPLGVANQSLIVANGRLEYSNTQTTILVERFFASGTWTKPQNFKEAIIYCIGGGGGGSGGRLNGNTTEILTSGGGGPGNVAILYANNAELTANVTVTVGAGGAGGNGFVITSLLSGGPGFSNNVNYIGGSGSNGGDTSFGAYITAAGGAGGASASGGGAFLRPINRTRTERSLNGVAGGAGTLSSGSGISSIGSLTDRFGNVSAILTGGSGVFCDDYTPNSGNTAYLSGSTIIYFGDESGGGYSQSTTKNGGNLVNGADGVAYPFHHLFLSLGGCSGYPQYRSAGANGGNGVYGSGGGGGAPPSGFIPQALMNTVVELHTGYGGRGGDGYVVVISTIGRE